MKIQFVCTGNTFRSRIAEAYLKSKQISDLEVTSSGIEAKKNLNGTVCEYTVSVLEKAGLKAFLGKKWHETTKTELENQDLVIFMEKKQANFCLKQLKCHLDRYEIWEIRDINSKKENDSITLFAKKTFEEIKENVGKLTF